MSGRTRIDGVVIFTVLQLIFLLGLALAQDNEIANVASIDPKITAEASDIPIIDAVDMIFRGAGKKYTIEPGVIGNISFSLTSVPFSNALQSLTDTAGLVYAVQDGRYIISPRPVAVKKEETAPVPDETQLASNEPISTESTDETSTNGEQENEQPVFYGSLPPDMLFYEPPLFPDIGIIRSPDFGLLMTTPIGQGSSRMAAPRVLPPPGLRSPSLDRMLDQMRAVHSRLRYPSYGTR